MQPNRRTRKQASKETVYEVMRAEQGWAVVRASGGYREQLPSREAARARACTICEQLAPARVVVWEGTGPPEEIIYGGGGDRAGWDRGPADRHAFSR